MKKYFLVATLFLLAGGINMQAQVKFGLKAGVGLSSVSLDGPLADNFSVSNLTGFKIGPVMELQIPFIGLGVETSLLYSHQGFGLATDNGLAVFNGFQTAYNGPQRLNALEFPIHLKYKVSLFRWIGVYASAGPYLHLRLSDRLGEQIKARSYGSGLGLELGLELAGQVQAGVRYQWSNTEDYRSVWSLAPSTGVTDVFRGKSKILSATLTCFF